MYFDTLTSIGTGSTGASGGTSACATCTRAGGGCMSMVCFPVHLHVHQVPAIGVLGKSSNDEKGGLVTKSPFVNCSWRSEVERHSRGRSLDCRAADGVVELIARAD